MAPVAEKSFTPTPGSEVADALQVRACIARVADGAVVPIDVGNRLSTQRSIVGVTIDFVLWEGALVKVGSNFFLTPGGVNDDLPSLGAQRPQGPHHVGPGRAQHTRSLPGVVFSDYAGKIYCARPPRILRVACHVDAKRKRNEPRNGSNSTFLRRASKEIRRSLGFQHASLAFPSTAPQRRRGVHPSTHPVDWRHSTRVSRIILSEHREAGGQAVARALRTENVRKCPARAHLKCAGRSALAE